MAKTKKKKKFNNHHGLGQMTLTLIWNLVLLRCLQANICHTQMSDCDTKYMPYQGCFTLT